MLKIRKSKLNQLILLLASSSFISASPVFAAEIDVPDVPQSKLSDLQDFNPDGGDTLVLRDSRNLGVIEADIEAKISAIRANKNNAGTEIQVLNDLDIGSIGTREDSPDSTGPISIKFMGPSAVNFTGHEDGNSNPPKNHYFGMKVIDFDSQEATLNITSETKFSQAAKIKNATNATINFTKNITLNPEMIMGAKIINIDMTDRKSALSIDLTDNLTLLENNEDKINFLNENSELYISNESGSNRTVTLTTPLLPTVADDGKLQGKVKFSKNSDKNLDVQGKIGSEANRMPQIEYINLDNTRTQTIENDIYTDSLIIKGDIEFTGQIGEISKVNITDGNVIFENPIKILSGYYSSFVINALTRNTLLTAKNSVNCRRDVTLNVLKNLTITLNLEEGTNSDILFVFSSDSEGRNIVNLGANKVIQGNCQWDGLDGSIAEGIINFDQVGTIQGNLKGVKNLNIPANSDIVITGDANVKQVMINDGARFLVKNITAEAITIESNIASAVFDVRGLITSRIKFIGNESSIVKTTQGIIGDVEFNSEKDNIILTPGKAITGNLSGPGVLTLPIESTLEGKITGMQSIDAQIGSTITVIDDSSAETINLDHSTLVIPSDLLFTGNIMGEDAVIDLQERQLTLNGNIILAGTPEILLKIDETDSTKMGKITTVDGNLDFTKAPFANLKFDKRLPTDTPNLRYQIFAVEGGERLDSETSFNIIQPDAPTITPIDHMNMKAQQEWKYDHKTGSLIFDFVQIPDPDPAPTEEVLPPSPISALSNVSTVVSATLDSLINGLISDHNRENGDNNHVAAGDAEPSREYGIWMSPLYSHTDQKAHAKQVGYKLQTMGAMIGGDIEFAENSVVGVGLGFLNSTSKYKEEKKGDKSKIDSYILSAYGMHKFSNNWFMQGAVHFAKHCVKNTIGSGNLDIHAKYSAYSGSVGGLIGYNIHVSSGATIVPMGGIRYSGFSSEDYKQEDPNLGKVTIDKTKSDRIEGIVGGKLFVQTKMNDVAINYNIHGFLNYNLTNKKDKLTGSLDNAGTIIPITFSTTPKCTSYNIGMGLDAQGQNGLSTSLNYDLHLAHKSVTNQIMLKLKWRL